MMNEQKLNEKSIEMWAKKFSAYTPKKPSRKLLQQFFVFAATELKGVIPKEIETILETGQGGFASVIYKRVNLLHTYELSITAASFLGECVIKNFAESTMLANYLQYESHRNGWHTITMREISEIFPNGFPSQKWFEERWADNKIKRTEGMGSDNLLDYPVYAKSIMIEKKRDEKQS